MISAQARRLEPAKSTVMIYRSKVDRSAKAGLLVPIILPVVLGLAVLISGAGAASVGWTLLLIGLAGVGPIMLLLLLLFAWPMTYDPGATRSDGEPILLVRGGRLLRYEIPIAGISEVRPTKSVLSSMSWSYDRIEVIYRSPKGIGGSLLISPQDRDAFLDDLARRAGDLVRAGDWLTRRQDNARGMTGRNASLIACRPGPSDPPPGHPQDVVIKIVRPQWNQLPRMRNASNRERSCTSTFASTARRLSSLFAVSTPT
jgi:hypothetical protein